MPQVLKEPGKGDWNRMMSVGGGGGGVGSRLLCTFSVVEMSPRVGVCLRPVSQRRTQRCWRFEEALLGRAYQSCGFEVFMLLTSNTPLVGTHLTQ